MKTFKPHPLAESVPMMSDAEFVSLRDSIDQHGQTDPVLLFEGKILDGRNRARAVHELRKDFGRDIELKTSDFRGDYAAAVQLVYARVNHRHLTDSQKAACAVNFLDHFEAIAQKRKSSATRDDAPAGRATENAGRLLGVNRQYVHDARTLRDADANLFRSVFEGATPLAVATREIRRRAKAKQHKAIVRRLTPREGEGDAWTIEAIDAIEGLQSMPAGSARLIFADPPYNIGIDYGRGSKADSLNEEQYLAWVDVWVGECHRVLTADGAIFLMIDAAHQADAEMILRGACESPAFHRRNVIVWHETFGTYQGGNFSSCWRPILYYCKHATKRVWNGDQILIESDRQKQGDARANPAGKVPSNVWEFPRLVDNARERVPGFPTQIPQALVERIVLACSDPGDLVVDPFTGSGTTAAAAVKHHRKFRGFEIVKQNAELARARVGRQPAERSV